MPILANLLISIVTALISFFAKFMVVEKAFRLSALIVSIGMAVTLLSLLSSCVNGACASGISGISSSHPNFSVGLGIAFNGTTIAAATCYVTVWLGCQLYVFQKKGLEIVVK